MPANNHSTAFTESEREAILKEHGRLVSFPRAAAIAGVCDKTLHRMANRGELHVYKVGTSHSVRLRTLDILDLVERVA